MKNTFPYFKLFVLLCSIMLLSACSKEEKAKKLAFKQCSSCHLYPEPSLLPKSIWEKNILPEMGFLLGMGDKEAYFKRKGIVDFVERSTIEQFFPESPAMSEDEWKLIQEYYLTHAPEKLETKNTFNVENDLENFFEIAIQTSEIAPCATFVGFDEHYKQFYTANKNGEINVYQQDFSLIKKYEAENTVADIKRVDDQNFEILQMGKMNPNNLPLGSLSIGNILDPKARVKTIAMGLNRPVHFQKVDFNNDGLQDYLVCSFGYHIGRLSWFEATTKKGFKEHYLNPISGSLKTVIRDMNGDGYQDFMVLMGQGNEGVYLFNNLRNGTFSQKTFLRLPPVYGSSDFAVEDFNNDGHLDIAVVCGDNGDLSQVLKPYHGVHFYLNDGQWNFNESSFIPLYGTTGLKVGDLIKMETMIWPL